jgi:hypothetical protein
MSKGQQGAGENWRRSEVSDLVLPFSVVEADIAERRADRSLAFARIEHYAASLGFGNHGAAYFKFPIDSSRERRIIVADRAGRFGEAMLRVWVNDEIPHPAPELLDVRRLHMTSFATSALSKRLVCRSSSADKVDAAGRWYGDGPFTGPLIFHDRELEIVEVRGWDGFVAPQLPHPADETSGLEETYERTTNAVRLAGILGAINPAHIVEGVSVVLPPAATLET